MLKYMETSDIFKNIYAVMSPHLNERQKRLLAAAEAQALAFGGVTVVAELSNLKNHAVAFMNQGLPVISVDTKKKELVGQYKMADKLLICADGGGSNGSRVSLWKVKLSPSGRTFDPGVFQSFSVATRTTKNGHIHFSSLEFSKAKMEIDDGFDAATHFLIAFPVIFT